MGACLTTDRLHMPFEFSRVCFFPATCLKWSSLILMLITVKSLYNRSMTQLVVISLTADELKGEIQRVSPGCCGSRNICTILLVKLEAKARSRPWRTPVPHTPGGSEVERGECP
jgi:hypothetical protein